MGNFPNLPTDNLYKFKAISCLIAAVVFYVSGMYLITFWYTDRYHEVYVEEAVIEEQESILQERNDSLEVERTRIFQRYCHLQDSTFSESMDSRISKEKRNQWEAERQSLRAKALELLEEHYRIRVRKADIEYQIEKDKADGVLINVLFYFMLGLFVFFISCAFWGFNQWIERHQKFEDVIVKQRAGVPISKKELKKLSKPKKKQLSWWKNLFSRKHDKK